jgi:spore maturation protein CgeB
MNQILPIIKKIVLLFKSYYQTLVTRFNIFIYKKINNNTDQFDLIHKKLIKRNFEWRPNKKTKVFIALSISNWEKILVDEISLMGEVYHFSWKNVESFFDSKIDWLNYHVELNSRLVREFSNFYDLECNNIVFFYASDFSISSQSINYLKRHNVLLISFCWDDILYYKSRVNGQPVGIDTLSKLVDFNLTFSPEVIPRYNFNETACFFWESVKYEHDIEINEYLTKYNEFYVLFVGTKYGWRENFIKQLESKGIKVKCFGRGWSNGILDDNELQNLVRNAPVTLGFANVGYTKNVTTIKGRDFEIPIWGGLYLTQYSEGLTKYYEIGKEVLAYKDINDCIKIINYLKNNPLLANQIRRNGYLKAINFTSWKSRFLYLNNLINSFNNNYIK